MDQEAQRYWEQARTTCPTCGGAGVPVVLEINDQETMEAVRTGLACLGECCFDGARGIDRECTACGHQWSTLDPLAAVD